MNTIICTVSCVCVCTHLLSPPLLFIKKGKDEMTVYEIKQLNKLGFYLRLYSERPPTFHQRAALLISLFYFCFWFCISLWVYWLCARATHRIACRPNYTSNHTSISIRTHPSTHPTSRSDVRSSNWWQSAAFLHKALLLCHLAPLYCKQLGFPHTLSCMCVATIC